MDDRPITIRAFRAVDEPETSIKFVNSHVNVLRSYGLEPVSSAKTEWCSNPSVYVLIAIRDGIILGGVKVHKTHEKHPLPLESSIGNIDSGIYNIVKKYSKFGTGEACGLWNAREVSGWGLSYVLMRAMISLTTDINVNRLFSLSSDHTIGMCRELGYRVIRSLGKNGDFNYPTPQYIARVILMNSKTLSWCTPYNKQIINCLRENKVQKRIESSTKIEMKIQYDISL